MRALETAPRTLSWEQELARRLAELDTRSLRRGLRAVDRPVEPVVERNGRRFLNLSSNNYLGLAGDPRIQAAAAQGARRGAGSTASRLLAGTDNDCLELEEELAAHKGTERALVFGSGYLANIGSLSTLLTRDDHVFADRLNHASIWDGIRLAGATLHRYRHADPEHLAWLLSRVRDRGGGRLLIVTETVFSMDGDMAPLEALCELKERFGAALVVDEAHAGGVFGPHGEGLAHELGVAERIDVQIGTFGKAYGVYGAYAAASGAWIELLISASRPFVYTTALPPPVIDAVRASLRIVRVAHELRRALLERATRFRERLQALDLDLSGSVTQIVPVVAGSSERALAFAAELEEDGILAVAIRPPTVPDGQARVRFSLSAAHTDEQLEHALEAIERTVHAKPLA
jgi:8-amino-7-oxononanoate synthase